MKQIIVTLPALLMLFLAGAPAHAAETCLTGGCHTEMNSHAVAHQPAHDGECLSCHQSARANHPSGQGNDFTLLAEGGELCMQCHDAAAFTGDFEHGPAAAGACITCHDPHGSAHAKLLRRAPTELCLDCHHDFRDRMNSAASIHSAIKELDCGACHQSHASSLANLLKEETTVLCLECHDEVADSYKRSLVRHKALYIGNRCTNCHQAHFSQHSPLLVAPGNGLCFLCHGGEQKEKATETASNIELAVKDKKEIHSPIEDGGCVSCHTPHGGSHSALLKGNYPESIYAPFTGNEYDFCFQCHDRQLLLAAQVEKETNFRNGRSNLHHLHVADRQKGRTCKVCHSAHASNGDKLINPEGVPFGDWLIPIRFKTTEHGGSCMPGCHRAMEYDRERAIDNSAPPPLQKDTQKESLDTQQQPQTAKPPGDSPVESLDSSAEQGTRERLTK